MPPPEPDLPAPRPSKIVCVGRNYGAHARELGHDVPSEPLLFLKPPSALLADGEAIRIPDGVGRVDFEGEIAFRVGQRCRAVPEAEALGHLSHVLPANDVTARDLQRRDDQWTRAKGFDTFLPVGPAVLLDPASIGELELETRLNGAVVQQAPLRETAFSPAFLVAFVSRVMTLEPGDLILTGTPEGVGRLSPGDEVEVRIPGIGAVRNPVERADGRAS